MPAGKPAFEELYREHVNRVYAFLRSQLRNAEDAEDVTSQVFMKAYEAYGRYEARQETPTAWLFQIARNAAHRHFAQCARQVPTVDMGDVSELLPAAKNHIRAGLRASLRAS